MALAAPVFILCQERTDVAILCINDIERSEVKK